MSSTDTVDVPSYYANFSADRDSRVDYEHGLADGEMGRPHPSADDLNQYELLLVHQGIGDISQYRNQLNFEARSIEIRLADSRFTSQSHLEGKKVALGGDVDRSRQKLEIRVGPNSPAARKLDDDFRDSELRYTNLEEQLERQPRLFFHKNLFWGVTPYVLIVLLLALIEVPINKGVFGKIIGESVLSPELFSVSAAFLFGLFIIILAHFIGMLYLQCKYKSFIRWSVLIALSLFVVITLYLMALIRTDNDFIAAVGPNEQTQIKLADADDVEFQGTYELPEVKLFRDLDGLGWFFLALNVGMVIIGAGFSFKRHDEHPDFERYYRKMNAAMEAKKELDDTYSQEKNLIDAVQHRRLNEITAKIAKLGQEGEELKTRKEEISRRLANTTDKVVNVIVIRVMAYQQGNNHGRGNNPSPEYFGQKSSDLVNSKIRNAFKESDAGEGVRSCAGEGVRS
jgi:hypothetical protein